MKVFFKKFLSVLFCALIFLSAFAVPSFAETGPVVTIYNTLTAVPGDTVAVEVVMSENPGIMAMTFTVSYDKNAFTFNKYTLGKWNDYTIVDHPDSGYVSFVNCEVKNRKYNATIFTLYFTVTDTAAPGEHSFKIMNINPAKHGDSLIGCFANKEHTEITPTVNNSCITIGKTCSNSGHTFSAYATAINPTCVATGIKIRSCTVCGHTETVELKEIGHFFESEWTVDTPATKETTGIMSRHCKNCSEVTDKVYFSFKDTEENNLKNEENSSIPPEDWEKLEEIDKQNQSSNPTTSTPSGNASDNQGGNFGNQQDGVLTEKPTDDTSSDNSTSQTVGADDQSEKELTGFKKFWNSIFGSNGFFARLFKSIGEFFINLFK